MKTRTRATIEDLYNVPGKAELVNGEIVYMAATGGYPGYAGDEIYSSLRAYARRKRWGIAVGDNKGFIVDIPLRETFSPDAAFYVGNITRKFYEGAPVFAVEVRSDTDYGPKAERAIAAKIHEYFLAGAQVVWDVDVLRDKEIIRSYTFDNPDNPKVFYRGEIADAEPALPGWTMPVDDLFWPGTWQDEDEGDDAEEGDK